MCNSQITWFSVSKNSPSHRKLVKYCYAIGKVVTLIHCEIGGLPTQLKNIFWVDRIESTFITTDHVSPNYEVMSYELWIMSSIYWDTSHIDFWSCCFKIFSLAGRPSFLGSGYFCYPPFSYIFFSIRKNK